MTGESPLRTIEPRTDPVGQARTADLRQAGTWTSRALCNPADSRIQKRLRQKLQPNPPVRFFGNQVPPHDLAHFVFQPFDDIGGLDRGVLARIGC